jgi:hypothetical protein
VVSGRRVTPSASPRSVKKPRPLAPRVPSSRATTTRRSAIAPSHTNDFSPWSVQPAPARRASSAMPSASQRPLGSASARAAIVSPAAISGRNARFCPSLPAFRIAFAASAAEPR